MLKKASIGQYLLWLSRFLEEGGEPTHYYDYPWSNWEWAYADDDFTMDGECGADAINIIVPAGIRPEGSRGHNRLFMFEDSEHTSYAPVFNNPEFIFLPGIQEFVSKQRERHRREDIMSDELGLPGPKSDVARFTGR